MRLALFYCFLVLSQPSIALEGRIVGVADGDTITLLDASHVQHKIRLAGIDAPEKAQPFGNRSKQSLLDLAFNRNAKVETGKKDRYGRIVGKVLVEGQDINRKQIELGMAWFYVAYQAEQSVEDRADYASAEIEAREAKRGLWRDASPIAPWSYRLERRRAQ